MIDERRERVALDPDRAARPGDRVPVAAHGSPRRPRAPAGAPPSRRGSSSSTRRCRTRRERRMSSASPRVVGTPSSSISVERPHAARDRGRAILGPDDELRDQRVVVGRDRRALLEVRVDPHAGPERRPEARDRSRRGREAARRILGVEPDLERVPAPRRAAGQRRAARPPRSAAARGRCRPRSRAR